MLGRTAPSAFRHLQTRTTSRPTQSLSVAPAIFGNGYWHTVKNLRGRLHHPTLRRQTSAFSSSAAQILTPPLVFIGLGVALWTWKCMMMVLFQNKIIYMPNVPPFARSERVDNYVRACGPVQWDYQTIKSEDGTTLAVCCGTLNSTSVPMKTTNPQGKQRDIIICYFQGNGGSLPPRLPMLSTVLRSAAFVHSDCDVRYKLLALSYRGYWQSSGRASESGIQKDSKALLRYAQEQIRSPQIDTSVILWGQSIGSGVATTLAAASLSDAHISRLPIDGLIMETPFRSIRSMLTALYPQKWLPYRYLGPFLWNHWDSSSALKAIATSRTPPSILLLPAVKDEVVPSIEVEELETLCKQLGLTYERKDISGALHNEASTKREGQKAIAQFISKILKR